MPTVIPVKFKYVAHDLWFDPADTGAGEGDYAICATERGQEIGLCTMDAMEMDEERLRQRIDKASLSSVVRIASESDLDRADKLARQGEDALPTFRDSVYKLNLDMKPIGVEYLFDGGRVVCYFSAEDRVDFRQLVRVLSRELRKRIDMRQIGVREEAALVGGFAHCGQELCCARLGCRLEPVSIRMAKEQDLPLNTSKISGACGRLMCCLRYEFDAYKDFKQRAPKRNAVIETPLGKAKIVEYDTPKEQICLRLENGKQVRIPLAEMQTSEAAVKKSEELHCPCRPDMVPRSALERLQSPEVQMALAELDRVHGVVPKAAFDSADIFVESKPRRRSRRSRRQDGSMSGAQGADGARSTFHSRGAKSAPTPREDGEPSARTQNRSKRRRKKGGVGGVSGGSPTKERVQETPVKSDARHRRRHHEDGDVSDGAVWPATTLVRSDGAGVPQDRSVRRRPGDRGGQQAKVQTRGQDGQRTQAQGTGTHEGTNKPKRRRRSGRGRGSGGGGLGAQGPGSDPSSAT